MKCSERNYKKFRIGMLHLKPGNWRAKLCPDYIVIYEQLVKKDSNGMNIFDKVDQVGQCNIKKNSKISIFWMNFSVAGKQS